LQAVNRLVHIFHIECFAIALEELFGCGIIMVALHMEFWIFFTSILYIQQMNLTVTDMLFVFRIQNSSGSFAM